MYKKWMVFILVVIMILALPINAMAARPGMDSRNYLNLGDSIAAGMSASEEASYFEGYSKYLDGFGFQKAPEWTGEGWDWFTHWYKQDGKFEDGNIAMPGMTSSCVLQMLSFVEPAQKMVEKADLITISIGGNNVLQPMIGAMMEAYSVTTIEELMNEIAYRGENYWNMVGGMLLDKLMYADPEECPLWQGVAKFQSDWPEIIRAIESLNPEAHIIVLSIYNPVSKMESPELYQLMEELIRPMNLTMRRHQSNQVSVANVFNAFQKSEDAVNFSVAWFPRLDPHPTNIGHQLIIEELMRVRNPRAFR